MTACKMPGRPWTAWFSSRCLCISRPEVAGGEGKAELNATAATQCPTADTENKLALILSPTKVLELAHAVVAESFADEVDAVALAAVALTESSGRAAAVHLNEDVGEARIGLCQVHLSTAKWLHSMKGYTRFAEPTAADLEEPLQCLYYCAAYLKVLIALGHAQVSTSEGSPDFDLEQFVIRAFHAGPKSWSSDSSASYWARYQHARWQLQRLQDALEASAAAPPGTMIMHVVHHSETLAKIASICGLRVEDILAANPELGPASCVQANDCIAIPLPVLLPRVYVVRPGETLHGLAKTVGVSAHRLLARNPELREAKVFAPGWVLSLPGLRGEHAHDSPVERCPSPSPASLPRSALRSQALPGTAASIIHSLQVHDSCGNSGSSRISSLQQTDRLATASRLYSRYTPSALQDAASSHGPSAVVVA